MVAIVTGNGLGVAGSSAGVLGVGGQLESAAAGGGASAYVNASTGNLVLQRQDEFLIGVGPDLGVVRTYNSQGSFDFDNNDSWQLSLYRHLSGLTGTVNTAGSTITRTGADGAQFVYTFDTTLGQYVNKDGAGSYDTLAYNSGADTWTWTDGDSRVTETYAAGTAGTWRIISTADTDGNTLSYSYDANNLITQVVDANGETTRLVYNGAKQLTQIDVLTAGNVTTTRVRYGYDGAGRLTSITTDLTPADGSITDGNAFVTTYTYDGASKRIASIVNSDGTHTSFTYDASGRIQTITDGLGRTTTLTYNAGNTVITDASGQSTTLTYDSVGQLTRLQGPVGSGQDIRYSYNANGDVTQLIDSRGNTVDYTYDANGNQTRQQDSAGQVVERTYSSANQLLTETVYAVADPDGAGAGAASAPQTTRYAYDGEQHLRFVVSPEGRVTEYRYNAAGQRTAAIQYSGTLYPVAGLGSTQSLSEADLTPFATTNQSASQRTDYTYDARGQLSTRTVYTQIDASGNGMLDGTEATTQYIYDQAGNLRQAIDARGVATPGIADDYVTTYAYDGLHRLVSRTDALGNTTTTVYNDANHQVVVTLANGLSTTSTYDAAGQLLAVAKSDISGALGTTGYLYDALGRVRQVTDPLGQKTTFLYDSANRQVGAIDGTGTLTETVYNANGQAIRTIRYAIPVNAAALAGDATQFTLAGVRPTTNSADRTAYTLYDQAGRVAKQIDALGAVTLYTYDGASRLVKTTQYANTLTTAQLTALKASTAEILPSDSNTVPVADTARDRVTRTLYDNDGLLVGTLDAAGYLTEYTYDAAGQPTAVIRYSTLSPSTYWASGTLAQLRPDANATNDQKTQTLYNARGEVVGVVDAEGYLTETQYDLAGNKLATTRYATKITYTPGNTLPQSRPAAHAEDQVVRAFFDANNRITRTESTPDGLVTTYAYDSVGNLTGTVKALGTTEERAQQYRYDSLGRVVAELGGEGTSALAALGANPTTGQIDDVWNRYGTRHVYDALGQRIATITPDGSTATGNRTRFYYDADDRLTHRINALGEVTEYRYDAFDGRTAERHYDTRIPSGILATLTGGSTASLGTAVSNLVADGYSESVVTYDLRGQAATLTDALGNVDTRSYNAFGELAQSTERIDASRTLTTSYAYDRRGLLTGTTQDVGGLNRITSALYDAFGRMTQATDARGGISKYSYDRLGRTVSVTNPLNVSETTTYDAFARTLTHTDGRGNVTTSSYDTTNRSLTVTTAEGISTTTVRNRHGETVSITDGRGNVTSYAYNRDGQLTSVTGPNGTTSTTYDSAGHVTTTTDARGIPTTYTYDAANRVLSRTVDPTGLNLKTEYRYDAHGRTAWVKDPAGIWTRTDFDAKGQVTVVTVDPTSVPDANGTLIANATGLNLTTAYTYDARGKTLTVTEGAGTASARTTEYRYDTLGRRTQQIQDPAGLNLVTAYTYDANDNVVAKTDANGHVTRYTYDADNRLTYTVAADGAVTKHDYDAHGNLSGITAYATRISLVGLATPASSADIAARITSHANDRLTRQVFDRDNRRTHSIDAAGYVTATTYDANGNVLTSTRYAQAATGFNADGTPQVAADAKDQVTQYTYDAANRVTDVTDAMGSVTHHVYDAAGHVTDTTRATGTAATSTTHYQYDAAGRVTDETRAYGTADASTTHYQYDALGHQTAITEAYGTAAARTTRQEFDAAGRKTAAIQVMGAGVEYRTTTEYNAAGDIVKVTDANGNAGYFYTDALGRVTLQVNPDGAAIAHTYDALGNETQTLRYATKVTGPLTTTSAPSVTTASGDQKQTASYDALGRRITIQTWWGSNAADYYTETFTYDAFGNVLTSTARNGAVTTTLYDKLNRKTSETLPIQSRNASGTLVAVVNTYAYDMAGNLTTKTEAAGLPEQRVTTYEYDRLDRQTQELGQAFLAYNPTTQTEASVTPTRSKTYDARGNVTSETDANGNQTFHYYDAQDRTVGAISADGTYTTWIYDAAGNKTSQTVYATPIANPATGTVPTPTPDSANDRTVLYSYDQLGRVTGTEIRNITTGTYNTTTGQYPVTTGSITTTTVYDALGNVIKTIDANGNVGRTYYNGAGQATAQLDAAGYLTTWTRDAYGNVSRETKYATKLTLSVTDGTTYAQLIASVTTSAQDRITDTTYDQINRITTESRLNVAAGTLDANGNLTTATSAATIRYAYDGLNNITQKTDATNQVTDWVYDGLGRQTRQLNPTMTDQNGTSVRPQMDTEYDGLSNVTRKLQRGTDNTAAATLSGQVESDDRIITYQYTAGKLTAETDAAGARIEYRYDANGNVTKKTLKNRVNADGSATDDVTLFFYDAQNRQAKTQDISTGLISEVRYDSFNQITGKRSYTGTAPTTWQEFAEYDRAGRMWKGNSGDGVTKVYAHDANGNTTLTLVSTVDLTSMSFAKALAVPAANTVFTASKNAGESYIVAREKAFTAAKATGVDDETANTVVDAIATGVPQQLHYTINVYDQRNQLVDTIQPDMTGDHDEVAVQAHTGQSTYVGNNSTISIAGGSTVQNTAATTTDPITPGTVDAGYGNVGWSNTGSKTSVMGHTSYTFKTNITIPSSIGLGEGNLTVVATLTVASNDGVMGSIQNKASTSSVTLSGSQNSTQLTFTGSRQGDGVVITGLILKISKSTGQGNIEIVNQAWSGNASLFMGQMTTSMPASGSAALPKRFYFTGQPSTNTTPPSDRMVMAYRSTSGPWTFVNVPPMVNTAGTTMAGRYAFDWSSIPANNYEYQYMVLDSAGNVLNKQGGSFDTRNASAPTISHVAGTIGGIGGAGRALIGSGGNINFVEQGNASLGMATHLTLRYRVKNSTTWNEQTYTPSSLFGAVTNGWFGVPVSTFTAGTEYDIEVIAKNASGAEVNRALTHLHWDANGAAWLDNLSHYDTTPPVITFTERTSTQYIDVSYRVAGSTGAFTTLGITPSSAGVFTWNANGLVPDSFNTYDYEVIVKAYDDGDILNNQSRVTLRLGANNSVSGEYVTINGNSLTKSGGTNAWTDADVYSKTALTGSAYVSARAGQTTMYGMFGLNADPTTDQSYTSLDYAWYTRPDGVLSIYENGTQVTFNGTYTTSDVLTIVYEGTTVKYLKNGIVQRSIATTAGRTFYFDSSLYNTGYTLNDIQFAQPALTATLDYDTSIIPGNTTVTITGTTIKKTSGVGSWTDADAYSKNGLVGGASASAAAGQTSLHGTFGLNSDPTTDRSYTSLDYAWFTGPNGALSIYESGTSIGSAGSFGTYTTSDVLSVVYEGTTVKYLKNGVVQRTVNTTAGRTFYFDSSLYGLNYTLNNVQFTATSTTAPAVTVNGNSIIKTGGMNNTWEDASAASKTSLTGTAYVSARAGQITLNGMFGLNGDPTTDRSYTSLDYAWYTQAGGALAIYENGTNIGSFGTYTTSDVLSIVYEGSTVRYLKNGIVQRTATTTTGRTFYFDSSLYSTGYVLNDIQFAQPALTTTLDYDTSIIAGATTVTVTGNTIKKTSGGGNVWTDADAYSKNGLVGGAAVSAKAGQTNLAGMFGLNADPLTDKSYTSLDYAWYPADNGTLYIYENGSNIGSFGTYTTSDLLSVVYEGTTVKYLKNGVVQRTVNTTAGRTFFFDSSLSALNYTLNNVQFTTTSTTTPAITINGNSIIKAGGEREEWDAHVYSSYGLTDNAQVSARAGQTTLQGAFGLNTDPTADKARNSLDYAWYTNASGALEIYESGTNIGSFGTYTTSDVLAIVYEGTTVKYLKNNVVQRITTTTAGRTFYFDSSLYSTGFIYNDIQFTAPQLTTRPTSTPVLQVLRITPTQTGVSYLDLGYRLKGSNADYTPLVAEAYTINNPTEYRAAIPAGLADGTYEYRYTAYAADTREDDYDLIVTPDDPNTPADETVYGTKIIQHALGSATGDFVVNGTSASTSRIDWVITRDTRTSVIHRRQEYNAFGEVVEEIDGNGNKVQFEYNTLGQLTIKRDPETDITLANGFVTRGTPETGYTYDLAGRLIAVKDANGNVNTQAWLAGADGNQIVLEKHADGGIVTRKFDVFGDLRSQTDEANRTTQYQYDNMGRLTQITRPSSALDSYTYDAAGNRISHTNALNATEKMDYDSLGRIVRTRSFMGFATQYSYVYSDAIKGLGGLTVGGWQKTTTEATGRTLVDHTDAFGRLTWHKDQGDHVFTYHYNQAGWLDRQTSKSGDVVPTGITYSNPSTGAQFSGQDIEYDHYANGYIKSIWDKATGTYTRYEYDADGNRTFEGYITLKNPVDLNAGAKDYYQYAEIEYDELNRIKRIEDPKAIISYEYDANSNRRMVKSVYHDGLNGAQRIQEYWYSYDQMNRFLVTMGQLSNGRATTATGTGTSIITGTTGTAIAYNFANERMQATNGVDGSVESYSYTADGYLSEVKINGTLRARRINDALGRVTAYREYDANGKQFYWRNTTYDQDNRVVQMSGQNEGTTDYFYYTDATDNAAATSGSGELARVRNVVTVDGSTTTVNTYYDYQYWDEAKQSAITTDAKNNKLKKNNKYWKDGYSDLYYDVNGHLAGAFDRVGNRNIRYVTDAQGQILLRDEIASGTVQPVRLVWGSGTTPVTYINKVHRYYYVDGKRVGDVGNEGPSRTDYAQALADHKNDIKSSKKTIKGDTDKYANFKPIASADFDQNYEPISPTYPGATATSYIVRNGDTLQSIALAVWGDSAMWYLIADANGLNSTQTLTAGMNLTIPNKVTNIHNNSGTYRVYNPGEAIGDVSPTLPDAPPPPKKKSCGGIAIILVAVVAVVVTIYTAGTLTTAAGATFTETMAAGATALAGGVTSAGMTLGFTGGLIAGAAGSMASQITGMALGVQDKFSWSGLATSALTAGLGASGVLPGFGDSIPGQMANAAVRNVVGQGIGIVTGQQHGFSWTSVAASAIAAPVTNALTKEMGLGPVGSSAGSDFARAATGAVVSATTRMVLEGGKLNWASVAADALTSFIQNRAQSDQIKQQRAAIGNTTEVDSAADQTQFQRQATEKDFSGWSTGKSIFTGQKAYVAGDSGSHSINFGDAADGAENVLHIEGNESGQIADADDEQARLNELRSLGNASPGVSREYIANALEVEFLSAMDFMGDSSNRSLLENLHSLKAEYSQDYRESELNASSFEGAYFSHLSGIASSVGLDAAINTVVAFDYATSRDGLIQDTVQRAYKMATDPLELIKQDIQASIAVGHSIVDGVKEFAGRPFNEQIDLIAEGGLSALAGGGAPKILAKGVAAFRKATVGNRVIDEVATNAVEHEKIVTKYLTDNLGTDAGPQVHLMVHLPDGRSLRVIPDVLERTPAGAFRINDAKFGYGDKDMMSTDLTKSFSPNQRPAFEAISNGSAKVTIANSKAGERFFRRDFEVGKEIKIEPTINVYVNTPSGVVLRKYP